MLFFIIGLFHQFVGCGKIGIVFQFDEHFVDVIDEATAQMHDGCADWGCGKQEDFLTRMSVRVTTEKGKEK